MPGQEACHANPGVQRKGKKRTDFQKLSSDFNTCTMKYTCLHVHARTHTHVIVYRPQTYTQYNSFNILKSPPRLPTHLALFQIHALCPLFHELYTHRLLPMGKIHNFYLNNQDFSNANSNSICLLVICSLHFAF